MHSIICCYGGRKKEKEERKGKKGRKEHLDEGGVASTFFVGAGSAIATERSLGEGRGTYGAPELRRTSQRHSYHNSRRSSQQTETQKKTVN
jgi:hypothetical protein